MPPEADQEELPSSSSDVPRVFGVNTRESAPRQVYIKKRDIEQHGHTPGCAGCRTMLQGGTRRNHSEECRKRMEAAMAGDERVAKAQEKRKEFADRMEAKDQGQEEKRRKAEERKVEGEAGSARRKETRRRGMKRRARSKEARLEEGRGRPRTAT